MAHSKKHVLHEKKSFSPYSLLFMDNTKDPEILERVTFSTDLENPAA